MEKEERQPQWGGTMSLGPLEEDVEERIVEELKKSGIGVRKISSEGEYIINIIDWQEHK